MIQVFVAIREWSLTLGDGCSHLEKLWPFLEKIKVVHLMAPYLGCSPRRDEHVSTRLYPSVHICIIYKGPK